MFSQDRLRELLDYDPNTGHFKWRKSGKGIRPDRAAGYRGHGGYIQIGIGKKLYYAHRLAWLYVHGEWPEIWVDHANGDGSDNRIVNLRCATVSQNMANTKAKAGKKSSSLKGVWFHKRAGKWASAIRRTHLGLFDSEQEAHAAYMAAAREHFGEFARAS